MVSLKISRSRKVLPTQQWEFHPAASPWIWGEPKASSPSSCAQSSSHLTQPHLPVPRDSPQCKDIRVLGEGQLVLLGVWGQLPDDLRSQVAQPAVLDPQLVLPPANTEPWVPLGQHHCIPHSFPPSSQGFEPGFPHIILSNSPALERLSLAGSRTKLGHRTGIPARTQSWSCGCHIPREQPPGSHPLPWDLSLVFPKSSLQSQVYPFSRKIVPARQKLGHRMVVPERTRSWSCGYPWDSTPTSPGSSPQLPTLFPRF